MKTTLPVFLLLCLCTALGLPAQQSGETELQGCLHRAGSAYVLVDQNGESQQVSYLKSYKNLNLHEVKLTGRQTVRTIDATPPGGASATIQRPYFQAHSVTVVSPNCQGYAPLK